MRNKTSAAKESLLSTEKPSKAIVQLAIPATLALLAKAIYNIVDTAYIGMLRDDNALAAVGVTLPLLLIMVSILLVSLDNFDASTTITSVFATFNNIGPGLGMVGPVGNFAAFSPLSKIVLTLDMLFGRLELYPMLILLLPTTWAKK